ERRGRTPRCHRRGADGDPSPRRGERLAAIAPAGHILEWDSVARMRGVIFDMDGVLVLSEPFIAEAAIRMFAEKGHTIGEDEFRPFIGTGEDRFIGGVAERRGIALDPA